MSDYFTRLAERTLGLALIVQPIKPSLFALEPDAGGATPFEISGESATAQTFSGTWQGVETPAQATSAVQSQHSQTEFTGPAVAIARASTGNIPVETPMPGAHAQGNLYQSGRHHRRPALAREPFSSNTVREFTPAVRTLEPAAQQSSPRAPSFALSQTLSASPGESSLSMPAARVQGGNATERSTSSGANPASAALVETSIMHHEQTIPRHVVLGERTIRSSQSLASLPTPQAQPELSTPEPAIQVTIGRVEVRAVTAPATTTRSQQQPVKPPAMGLDEYLRRQEQGGRR